MEGAMQMGRPAKPSPPWIMARCCARCRRRQLSALHEFGLQVAAAAPHRTPKRVPISQDTGEAASGWRPAKAENAETPARSPGLPGCARHLVQRHNAHSPRLAGQRAQTPAAVSQLQLCRQQRCTTSPKWSLLMRVRTARSQASLRPGNSCLDAMLIIHCNQTIQCPLAGSPGRPPKWQALEASAWRWQLAAAAAALLCLLVVMLQARPTGLSLGLVMPSLPPPQLRPKHDGPTGSSQQPVPGQHPPPLPCLFNTLLRVGDVRWSTTANGAADRLSVNGCELRRYSAAEARQCLAGKRLVFVGDSVTRCVVGDCKGAEGPAGWPTLLLGC